MFLPPRVQQLIDSFEKLPGIGAKTASRLTFYLLHVPQSELDSFAKALAKLKKETVLCSNCKNISSYDPCPICADRSRDRKVICVVEQPLNILAMERTGKYKGLYHVLHGLIDPLNNIGPDEIYLSSLYPRLKNGVGELILGLNPTMEGEATAMYIGRQFAVYSKQHQLRVRVTSLARGLPVGGDIEYADEITLSRALEGRREI